VTTDGSRASQRAIPFSLLRKLGQSPRFWRSGSATATALLALGIVVAGGPWCATAGGQTTSVGEKKSWTDSITSGFKKLGDSLTPKKSPPKESPANTGSSLKTKAKPGPELYVALAHLYEDAGKLADADAQYQLALKKQKDYLPALLGYAWLKEQLGLPNDAIGLYQRAANAYPDQPSVHSNMGLCYARQRRFDEAMTAMNRAVQLAPKNPLYRNNIAAVFVEQGQLREAFEHLKQVHGNAGAYYNIGYLLNKRGKTQAAQQFFALALQADPSMTSARQWTEHLQKTNGEARVAQRPAPMPPVSASLAPPAAQKPRVAPPIAAPVAAPDGPQLPGMSYPSLESSSAPAAPLPPATGVRRLPRVE
jgi:Tfp pilus assembly protein PilF